MPKPNNLSFARLVDWIEGRLSEEETAAVAEQVATADETTRTDLAWLRAFKQVSNTTVLVSPPPEVREYLVHRFEAYAQGRQQPGLFQRLVASLTFDSGAQLAAAGVRGAGVQQGSQRQFIYATDVADIALNVQPRVHDQHLDLNGQIFPGSDAVSGTFSIQLMHGATELGITTADELGEFAFEAIPPGVYEITVSTGQFEVLIAPVELQI